MINASIVGDIRGNYNPSIMLRLINLCYHVLPVAGAKIVAALVYKNRIISIGNNQRKTHPLQKRYGKNPSAIYLHAEIDCLRHCINDACILYIARVLRDGTPALAAPCSGCRRAIIDYNIKGIIFTNGETSNR